MCSHAPRFSSARRRHIRILSERRSTFAGRSHSAIDVDDHPACALPLPLASRQMPRPACLDFIRSPYLTPAGTMTRRHSPLGAPANIAQKTPKFGNAPTVATIGPTVALSPGALPCLFPIIVVTANLLHGVLMPRTTIGSRWTTSGQRYKGGWHRNPWINAVLDASRAQVENHGAHCESPMPSGSASSQRNDGIQVAQQMAAIGNWENEGGSLDPHQTLHIPGRCPA